MEELDRLAKRYPIIPHGVGLSFGTDGDLDRDHLSKVAELVERLNPSWFTEHMAYTHAHGWNVGHLAPMPFTREAAAAIARNARLWRDTTGLPLVLENISYMVALPGELTESQFIAEVAEQADCGLLLDLHNVYTNSVNHRYDPFEFIDSLPLERVVQVHLGGGHDEEGWRIDSHNSATPEPVWDLLKHLVERADLKAVIVEWDKDLPPFEVMREQAHRAATILEGARGAGRSAGRACAAVHG